MRRKPVTVDDVVGATQRDTRTSEHRDALMAGRRDGKIPTVQLTVRIASDLKRSLDLSVARINSALLAEGCDAISHRDIIEAVLAPALRDLDDRGDDSELMQHMRQRAGLP